MTTKQQEESMPYQLKRIADALELPTEPIDLEAELRNIDNVHYFIAEKKYVKFGGRVELEYYPKTNLLSLDIQDYDFRKEYPMVPNLKPETIIDLFRNWK